LVLYSTAKWGSALVDFPRAQLSSTTGGRHHRPSSTTRREVGKINPLNIEMPAEIITISGSIFFPPEKLKIIVLMWGVGVGVSPQRKRSGEMEIKLKCCNSHNRDCYDWTPSAMTPVSDRKRGTLLVYLTYLSRTDYIAHNEMGRWLWIADVAYCKIIFRQCPGERGRERTAVMTAGEIKIQ
jgi:hypothetical protein